MACLVEFDGVLTKPPSDLSLLTVLAPAGVVALDLPADGVEAGVDVLSGPVIRGLPVLVVPAVPAGVAGAASSTGAAACLARRSSAAEAALFLLASRLSESEVSPDSMSTSSAGSMASMAERSGCLGGGERRLGSSWAPAWRTRVSSSCSVSNVAALRLAGVGLACKIRLVSKRF